MDSTQSLPFSDLRGHRNCHLAGGMPSRGIETLPKIEVVPVSMSGCLPIAPPKNWTDSPNWAGTINHILPYLVLVVLQEWSTWPRLLPLNRVPSASDPIAISL